MKFLKIIIIGFCTTVIRIIGQLLIPATEQTVLAPSFFVENGTLPIAFAVYGLTVYSLIAALFLLIEKNMVGTKLIQGFKYGLSCCAIWIAYLLEPLPHVVLLDKFTYPIADSIALIVMGLLCGLMFGKNRPFSHIAYQTKENVVSTLIITVCFVMGRLLQYLVFNSYSTFDADIFGTLLWCLFTGLVISVVILWLNQFIKDENCLKRAMILGLIMFGVDLTVFNFFAPLVFDTDIPNLIMRTVVDILAVMIACLFVPNKATNRSLTCNSSNSSDVTVENEESSDIPELLSYQKRKKHLPKAPDIRFKKDKKLFP